MNRKTEEKKRNERMVYIIIKRKFLFEVAKIEFVKLSSEKIIINSLPKKDQKEYHELTREYKRLIEERKNNEQRRILHDTETRDIRRDKK